MRRRAGYAAATQLGWQTVTVDQGIIERARARLYVVVLSDVLGALACRHQVVAPRIGRFDDSLGSPGLCAPCCRNRL
jgi:hypothetical protein